ncbi:MAG: hypothetical protein EKE20_16820 [Candidatus Symbiopectobacterium sp. Dall1.0]|nr:hypothetical protein [Candidatus Symbiopectobacterium sp. Dall1.0]
MDITNYSKPSQQEIDRAETDLLIILSKLTGRKFAEFAGCHESKISRTDWRFIATVLCVAKKSIEFSILGEIGKQIADVVMGKEKAGQWGSTFPA